MANIDALIPDLEHRDKLIQFANLNYLDDNNHIKDFAIPGCAITSTEGALTELALELKETNKILQTIANALINSNRRENEMIVMKNLSF